MLSVPYFPIINCTQYIQLQFHQQGQHPQFNPQGFLKGYSGWILLSKPETEVLWKASVRTSRPTKPPGTNESCKN